MYLNTRYARAHVCGEQSLSLFFYLGRLETTHYDDTTALHLRLTWLGGAVIIVYYPPPQITHYGISDSQASTMSTNSYEKQLQYGSSTAVKLLNSRPTLLDIYYIVCNNRCCFCVCDR